jgi:hemolysin activation/secretion protein
MNLANVSWQTPFNGLQDRLTVSATMLRYQLGDSFQALNASGTAKSIGANWTRTLQRDHQNSLFGSLDFTRRVLDDIKEATSSSTSKTANVLVASLNGYSNGVFTLPNQLSDSMSYGLSYTMGHMRLDSTDSTVGSPRGHFDHVNTNISYQRALTGRWSAGFNAVSQYASQNQDSSERIGLGGPSAVRAYGSGEGSGDRGAVMQAEVRYAFNYNWQASGFYDSGVSTVQVTPAAGSTAPNSRHLAGAGLGLQYSLPRAARIKAALAWRTTSDVPQLDTDRKPRLWVNGVVYF